MFEAAFALEDSEGPSRSGTPKPPGEKNEKEKSGRAKPREANEATPAENGAPTPDAEKRKSGAEPGAGDKSTVGGTPIAELPMEVRVKLRKFERLESTYTG